LHKAYVKDFACPEIVHAEVTARCNLNCAYCYVPKEQEELGLEAWKTIFKQLGDFGVFQLTFGGGEPFLRPDVCQLAKIADDYGLNVTVTTNGALLDSWPLEELAIFRQINISYHSQSILQGFQIEKALARLSTANIPVAFP